MGLWCFCAALPRKNTTITNYLEITMTKKLSDWLYSPRLFLSVLLTASTLLAACAPAAAPTTAPAAAVQPTTAPAATAATAAAAAPLPNASSIKVGLVTDTGGVKDQAFNQLAWAGVQKAAQEMGFQAKFIESQQLADYEKNIDALASEGYTVILTVGAPMADATALKARQYPNLKFAITDNAYVPTQGSQSCDGAVQDCYANGALSNVTSLMFAEDQVGFLAGVLAGGMSRSGFVCSVSSIRTPQSERYMKSFFGGAVWQAGAEMKFMNNYINIKTTDEKVPSSADSTEGKETALRLIGSGCDVVFGVGGEAVKGALLAAKENNRMAVGADIDQYNTDPEVQSALITSAMKNVDAAVYNYLKTVADGSVKAGIRTATLQNGGVGLAPFHDWDSKIPTELKARIQKASDGLKDGSIIPH
jgi:basic membrane protein A and related proteins